MGHGVRWTVVVISTLGAFAVPWAVLTAIDAGPEAALALASTASASVLSAGGWFAARGSAPASPTPGGTPMPSPDEPLIIGPLPHEPLAFQERAELFEAVEMSMESDRVTVVCALTGGRGVGKTQLAGAYARACVDAGWSVVVWIVAEVPGQVVAGLDEVADVAGVKGGIQDAQLAAAAARRWLERLRQPALLVLDNVVDPDEVAPWLPRTGPTRTLITSTVRSVTHLGATVDIGVFTRDEAVAFLRRTAGAGDTEGRSHAEAGALAEDLGKLPLALAQAAWVIRTQGLTFAEYRDRFRHNRLAQVVRRAPGEPYPMGAAAALALAIEHVQTGEDAAAVRRVVELMSLLSPSGVHRDDLRSVCADQDVARTDGAVGRLCEASVVTLSLDGTTVLMHRLVQRIVRDQLIDEGRLGARLAEASAALRRLLTEAEGATTPDAADRGLTDHILALWAAAEPLGDDGLRDLLDLPRAAVTLLVGRGEAARACAVGQEMLAEHERLVPPQDDNFFAALDALTHAYQALDRFDVAVVLRERSVAAARERFGPLHPKPLRRVNALGYALEGAGRLDDAEALHRKNLADSLGVNGPDTHTTLLAQINLASTLRSRGDDAAALALFEKNARDSERGMGSDHGVTRNARGELARMYERVGRYEDSLALHDLVLADTFRTERRGTYLHLWWGRYRALALEGVGRVDDAIEELNHLLRLGEEEFGHDNPETLVIRLFLARAHTAAGHHSRALKLFAQVASDRRRVLGPDSRRSLNARRNLGLALLAAGKRSRAVSTLSEVLVDYERVLGPAHPYTEGARADLARARGASMPARRAPIPRGR
ncbi:FxSxx-COOH system tetratricopeptide repeat protein [Streptomyces sp. NBC_01283]|uniref:FxSxx-COOH system tetratricopeptide repeat protein n=1 Tax=Streptomyces sp. NBC_01283 TaxID=2903812 RepID=UPI00352F2C65|nr:FxSxx-COOH system tetratricopeptide repeat protein [Streptomyces sp. NBC_01283]